MSKQTLLLTPDFPPREGGVARYLSAIHERYPNRVTVVTDVRGAETRSGVFFEALTFKHIWPKWLRSFAILWRRRHAYDQIFVSHLVPFGLVAAIWQFATHTPFVLLMHGMDWRLAGRSRWKRFLRRFVVRRATVVIVNSLALEREVLREVGPVRTCVVYPTPAEQPATEESSSEELLMRFLTVSRLVHRKGHARVLEALSGLTRESWHYDIVGSGPELQQLKDLVAQYSLEDRVTFHGQISDETRTHCYERGHVFVMPVLDQQYDKEGFGTVYVEAAQYGMPSVATDIPGVDEAVLHEKTGILIPDGDIDALRHALKTLLRNPEMRMHLGRQAKQRASDVFARDNQLSKLDEWL